MRKPSLRKTAAILFIVVLLAGLAACGGDEDPDGRIVKINDEAITNGQFENFCTLWLYTQGFDPSEPLTSDQKSLALGDMDQCGSSEAVLRKRGSVGFLEFLSEQSGYFPESDEDRQCRIPLQSRYQR